MVQYFKNRKIKRPRTDIEPQEIFLDNLAQKKQEELGGTDRKLETPLSKRLLQSFLALCLLLLLILFVKTLQLQVIEGKAFIKEAERNQFRVLSVQATRGVIYDRNLKQLVFNNPAFDLIIDKRILPQNTIDRAIILKELASLLNKDYSKLKKEVEDFDSSQILIAESLGHNVLIALEAKIVELPGIEIRNKTTREYVAGPAFSHVLGYTGKIAADELEELPDSYSILDYVGKDGLEKYYEQDLRKNSGQIKLEKDALGNLLSKEVIALPQAGKSLVLWIDSGLQDKAAKALKEGVKRAGSEKGIAVALNPKTGGVLALVSFPFFDNNLFSKKADQEALVELLLDTQQPLFNRITSGVYAVGSTIKPLIAAAALQEKIISPTKSIFCEGAIKIKNPYYPAIEPEYYTHKDWSTHGYTDVRKAIAESCNVYFYTIGGGYKDQEGLGPARIKKYLELFGWGSPTLIDLPGEKQGFIPTPAWKKEFFKNTADTAWYDGDTYNLSIGQGYISITPIQVVSAFGAIANRGKLISPKLVQKIITDNKKTIKEIEPEVLNNNFIDPENIKAVRDGMRQAVTAGSASGWLDSLPVALAAKTGTAQASKPGFYHNWVTVFGPYKDPEIVLTIMVENVEEAKVAALPIAKEILEWYFANQK